MPWDDKLRRYGEGTALGLWRDYWKNKADGTLWEKKYRRNTMHFVEHAFNHATGRFPQLILGPLETWYWKSVKRYGQETWWAPHNLYRQVFHILGGMTWVLVPLGMRNEIDNGYKGVKTWLDICAWICGQAITAFFIMR